jgi:hypothetical protein
LFIPVRPGEGRLTETTAAIQPWRRELIFTPQPDPWPKVAEGFN